MKYTASSIKSRWSLIFAIVCTACALGLLLFLENAAAARSALGLG